MIASDILILQIDYMMARRVHWAEDTKTCDGNSKHPNRYDATATYVREKHPEFYTDEKIQASTASFKMLL